MSSSFEKMKERATQILVVVGVLLAVAVSWYFWEQEQRAPDKEMISYLPDNCAVMISINPEAIVESTLCQKSGFKEEVERELEGETGLPIGKLSRILIGLRQTAPGASLEELMIVKSKESITGAEILKRKDGIEFEKIEVGRHWYAPRAGYTLYRHGDQSFCVPTSNIVVYGSPDLIDQVIKYFGQKDRVPKNSAEMGRAQRELDFTKPLVTAIDNNIVTGENKGLDGLALQVEFKKERLPQGKHPPEWLQPFVEYGDYVHYAQLTTVLLCRDGKAAEQLASELEKDAEPGRIKVNGSNVTRNEIISLRDMLDPKMRLLGRAPRSDEEALRGVWTVDTTEENGEKKTLEGNERPDEWVVAGDHIAIKHGAESFERVYKIDPSKKPRTIDIMGVRDGAVVGGIEKGIYELAGNGLKVCFTTDLRGERPTEFATRPSSESTLLSFRRQTVTLAGPTATFRPTDADNARKGYSPWSAALSPDNSRIAFDFGLTAKLWDTKNAREVRRLDGDEWRSPEVSSVSFSPDGRYVFAACNPSTASPDLKPYIIMWDAETGKDIRHFEGHEQRINSVVLSSDGRHLLSGGKDKTIRLWDVQTGRELRSFQGLKNPVWELTISRDGRQAISCYEINNNIDIWNLEAGKEPRNIQAPSRGVDCVAFSPDVRRALFGIDAEDARFGDIVLWDLETNRELQRYKGHRSSVSSVAFLPDGRRILSGSNDKSLRLWEAESGRELCRFQGHADVIRAAVLSHDGKRMLSCSKDATVRLWQVPE